MGAVVAGVVRRPSCGGVGSAVAGAEEAGACEPETGDEAAESGVAYAVTHPGYHKTLGDSISYSSVNLIFLTHYS